MRKKDLIRKISEQSGIEQVAVRAVVELLFVNMRRDMVNGEHIFIRGFGSFILMERKAKFGRDIGRGKPVFIPAHKKPFLKPCIEFLNEVKQHKEV